MRRTVLFLVVLILAFFAGMERAISAQGQGSEGSRRSASSQDRSRSADTATVQVAMKNVMYHFNEPIAAHIIQLQGRLTPTKPGSIVVFDDKNSFLINLDSAEIAINCTALAQVMNEDVFNGSDAPIKNVEISSGGGSLTIKGNLRSKHGVSFEVSGMLFPNGDGRIRFHADRVKAAHLPVKGLLDLLGLDLANLISTKKVQGISVDKDDLLLNPQEIFPPPHIRGNITAIRIQGDDIVQVFGTLNASNFAAKQPGNYMAYHDNEIRFGKLVMNESDLILIDMDPKDPFDFYLDRYKDQLAAGYTKTTLDFGLRVYTRDYNKLHKPLMRGGAAVGSNHPAQ
jgi:hypothetical protein